MLKAIKANKIYTISETEKASYLSQGYDITDDSGNVLERSPTATVSRSDYEKVLEENRQLTVYQTYGLNRDGSKKKIVIFEGKCFHQEKAYQKLTAEKQLIILSGAAFFSGDISPDTAVIEGYAEIGGREYKIFSSEKAKNLDGTVNFTRLELM